jgi:NADH-quinone oxidoreductase subunit N
MPPGFKYLLNTNLQQFQFIQPEMMVIATFLLALVFDFAVPQQRRKSTAYICIIGLLCALWLNVQQNQEFIDAITSTAGSAQIRAMNQHMIFSGMLVYDHFGTFFNFIILLGTVVALLLSIHARELFGKNHGEFYLLLVAVCMGGMFLASSANLLMIYLSLESLSIISYAMAGFLRRDRKSAEAGIKYVIYGAMASGIMLFGMSYLYGMTGTLNVFGDGGIAAQVNGFEARFHLPAQYVSHGQLQAAGAPHGGLIAVLAMVFAGFLYKIAAVPFHYWSPDVYEGAPTVATGFFSVVPKAAGFAVLIRCICAFFPVGISHEHWLSIPGVESVIGVIAVLTMTIGNLAALGQTNAKRMLAYSSIAHAGYMLAGLSVLDYGGASGADGPSAVLFYLVVYLFMNLGAFVVLVALENIFGGTDLRQLKGAAQREPVLCAALCAFLFSLTGLPPFGGFMGKYLIMWKLADRGHYLMIMFIGINSVISLYYYMKLAKAVAIDKHEEEVTSTETTPFIYRFLALGKCTALLLLFFYFEPIARLCRQVLEPLRF